MKKLISKLGLLWLAVPCYICPADYNCFRTVEAETVHRQHSRGGGYGEKERPV